MAVHDVCGNDDEKAFKVTAVGETHAFDSFERAIHLPAPTCEHCSCKVIGHGVEADARVYCCRHCADRADGDSRNAKVPV
jgi:hypothetical protein